MSDRIDVSPNLVHFAKGHDYNNAFNNLTNIIGENIIYGSNNMIKGGYKCVCFSEAPLPCITNGLNNNQNYTKYSPFGIMTSKKWLFSIGGRPVIYQTEEEYNLLVEEKK